MRGEFEYRDGDNYKFHFTAEIPEGLKVGDETTYEALGYSLEEFFEEVVEYKYDPETDHNIVELIEIEP